MRTRMMLSGWAIYRRNAQGYTYREMVLEQGFHTALKAVQ